MRLRMLRRAGSTLANIQKKKIIITRDFQRKPSQAQGGVRWLLDSRWPELDSCCRVAACIGRYREAGKGAGYRGLGWDVNPREEHRNASAFSGSGSVKRGDHSRAGGNRQ